MPIAKQRNIEITTLNDKDYSGLCDTLKTKHPGEHILIVGHSYSIPKMFKCLTSKHSDIDANYFSGGLPH